MTIKCNFIKGEIDSIDISNFFMNRPTITAIFIDIPNEVASEAATGI